MRLLSTCLFLVALAVPAAKAADRLNSYPVDPTQISVAGISSGAFMASQIHIAHSADVMGAALIAGGLYGCAVEGVEDDGVRALVTQAVWDCMLLPDNLKDVSAYADTAKQIEAKGWIDPLANLARSKLYVFSGASDHTVPEKTVTTGVALYEALGVPPANIVVEDRSGPAANAGHSWVAKTCCEACDATKSPFIDNCGYDQAGAELRAIYGPDLKPAASTASGRIVAFDQKEFAPGGEAALNGLSDTGYLYVPKACEPGAGQACRLQVVLHGCQQSAEKIGDTFYTKIGVNEWADANAILVLYPQAHALFASNPVGCWNWWGYAGDDRFLAKRGAQVDAIWKMIERMEGK